MTSPLLSWVLRRRGLVLGGLALLVLTAIPGIARLRTDNSPAVFFPVEGTERGELARLRARFGSDVALRVVVEGARTPDALAWLARAEGELAQVAGVTRVLGPCTLAPGCTPEGAPEGATPADRRTDGALGAPEASEVEPSAAAGTDAVAAPGAADPAALRAALERTALARDLGVLGPPESAGSTFGLLLVLRADDPPAMRRAALAAVERTLARPPPGVHATVLGLAVLERALDASSREVHRRFFPLLVGLAAVLLYAAFRSLAEVAVTLVFVGACELAVFGAMGWAGATLNLVLAVLAPALFVVALATAIHLLTRHRMLREEGLLAGPAVIATYADKRAAVLWTGASTAAGFGSLATSGVGPVRDLGVWAAIGIVVTVALALVALPALLAGLGGEVSAAERRLERLLQARAGAVAHFAVRRRRPVLVGATLLAVLAGAGLERLRIESNALRYLAADHPVRRAVARVERLGLATGAVELVVDAPPAVDLRRREALGALSWLAERMREEPGVVGVVGPGGIVDDALVRQAGDALLFGVDPLREEGARRLLAAPASPLAAYLAADGRSARLTVSTRLVGYDELDPLLARLQALVGEELPGARVAPTGELLLLLATQRQLLATLGGSLAATLLVVAAVFLVLLRRVRLTALAMVPNLLPVLLVFGFMGWAGVPLDVATVMVASTTLGLAVDDTIHTLAHYRERVGREGAQAAVLGSVERNAPAHSLTGVVLCLGFAVCAASSFAPIRRFGALSAGAAALAVLLDFVLVPALLAVAPARLAIRRGEAEGGA